MQRWLAHSGGLRLADLVADHLDVLAGLPAPADGAPDDEDDPDVG